MGQVVACWTPLHAQGGTFLAMVLSLSLVGKYKTLLVDANFTDPRVCDYVGVESGHRMEQLFPYVAGNTLTSEVFRVHLEKRGSLHVLPGMGRRDLAFRDDTAEFMTAILRFASNDYDIVVVDAGAGILHAGSYTAIAAADRVLVIMTPNFLVARELKHWQGNIDRVLPKSLHAPKAGLVLNRWDKKLYVSREEISAFCDLPLWGEFPNDPVGFLNHLNRGELWKYAGETAWADAVSVLAKAAGIGGGA